MRCLRLLLLIVFPLNFIYCSPRGNLDYNLNNIIGVWNRTLLDDDHGYEPDDGNYRVLECNGKKYAGYLNSLYIERTKNDIYRIICDGGNDIIVSVFFMGEQIMLDVENKQRETKGKVILNLISEDIIYFTLLEGDIYSFIDYGQDKPYIRARQLSE